MREEGKEPPRGILQSEDGEWAIPILFGVDAKSKEAAVAFAIDHNNLTLLGGNLGFSDLLQLWDEEGLQKVLQDVPDAGDLSVGGRSRPRLAVAVHRLFLGCGEPALPLGEAAVEVGF